MKQEEATPGRASRIEMVLRGIFAGSGAVLIGTGLVTVAVPDPSPFLQYVQLDHCNLGHYVILIGILYTGVHLYQTLDRRWFSLRSRSSIREASSASSRPTLLALLSVLIGANAFILAFVFSIHGRSGSDGADNLSGIVSTAMMIGVTLFVLSVAFAVRLIRRHGFKAGATRWLLLLACAATALTGLLFGIGTTAAIASVDALWLTHVSSGFACVLLLAMHIASSRRTTKKRHTPPPRLYPWTRPILTISCPVALLLSWAIVSHSLKYSEPENAFYADRRAIVAIDTGITHTVPLGCEGCHSEASSDWNASAHHDAADNPLFLAVFIRAYREAGPEVARFCLGCHAPHSPDPSRHELDEILASETFRAGVHCVSCHRSVPGPAHGNGSLVGRALSEDPFTLISDMPGAFGGGLERGYSGWLLVRPRLARHRETWRFQSHEPESCLPCHVQTLDLPTGGRLRTVLQNHYDSWLESPAAEAGRDCKSCHMPRYRTQETRLVTDHSFIAASTYLAALRGGSSAAAEVVDVLEGRRARPNLSFLDRESGDPGPLLEMEVALAGATPEPVLEIRTRNSGRIGHSFPNGPTDLLQIWLSLRVEQADGQVLLEFGQDGPEGAPKLGHDFEDAAGQLILDHRLWDVARVIEHGQIPVTGDHRLQVPLPAGALDGPIEVVATWNYRRNDPELVAELTGMKPVALPIARMAEVRARLVPPARRSNPD